MSPPQANDIVSRLLHVWIFLFVGPFIHLVLSYYRNYPSHIYKYPSPHKLVSAVRVVTEGGSKELSSSYAFVRKSEEAMAGSGSSMLYSILLFTVILSLQQMYRGKLASTELFTILGGFISSLLFLALLTFIGNFQETSGIRTGWGAVIIAEVIALIAAGTVHRVCITTCFLFSAGLLYEVNKLSGIMLTKSESKTKRY
ncbi:uncharacterized protein [Malus domestica]